jgi:hypothetical protein
MLAFLGRLESFLIVLSLSFCLLFSKLVSLLILYSLLPISLSTCLSSLCLLYLFLLLIYFLIIFNLGCFFKLLIIFTVLYFLSFLDLIESKESSVSMLLFLPFKREALAIIYTLILGVK